jgi:hypothetical protein
MPREPPTLTKAARRCHIAPWAIRGKPRNVLNSAAWAGLLSGQVQVVAPMPRGMGYGVGV